MSDVAAAPLAYVVAVRSVLGTAELGGAVFSGTTEDGSPLKVVASHRALHIFQTRSKFVKKSGVVA